MKPVSSILAMFVTIWVLSTATGVIWWLCCALLCSAVYDFMEFDTE